MCKFHGSVMYLCCDDCTCSHTHALTSLSLSLSLSQELLGELNLGSMRSGVPMLAVTLALEAKASHRGLTSRLISDLCGKVLSRADVESSFDKLLRELSDLVLDTPGAPQVMHVCCSCCVLEGDCVCVGGRE